MNACRRFWANRKQSLGRRTPYPLGRALASSPEAKAKGAVTAEVASSSLVVPAIVSKRLRLISLKPTRVQKGTFRCPFLHPFRTAFLFAQRESSHGRFARN
jgi:hypothetical protein